MSDTSADFIWLRSVAALSDFVDRLPPSPYRHFQQWLLADQRCRDRWLQVNALRTQTRMTNTLLEGLLEPDEIRKIADYLALYNVYLTQEVVSDNLAIGLADRAACDLRAAGRAEVLMGFTTAMIARLRGGPSQESARMLDELAPNLAQVSLFDQSLAESEHRALAGCYLAANPRTHGTDLEFSARPALAANIESCSAVADVVADLAVRSLVTDGLIARYTAVRQLIEDHPGDTEQLVFLGARSILVVPTLAFYAGVLADLVTPLLEFRKAVNSGVLAAALTDAAAIVRLLNDTGTILLEQSPIQREAFRARLHSLAETDHYDTLGDILIHLASPGSRTVTRLVKDLRFGEFNVCLDGIRDLSDPGTGAVVFLQRLEEISRCYRDGLADLRHQLGQLDQIGRVNRVAAMIVRFVEFHRVLYGNPYETRSGEYGIDGRQHRG